MTIHAGNQAGQPMPLAAIKFETLADTLRTDTHDSAYFIIPEFDDWRGHAQNDCARIDCEVSLKTVRILKPSNAALMLVLFLAFLLRCYHLTYPLNDMHAFRQTQTAGLIRDYYHYGIN